MNIWWLNWAICLIQKNLVSVLLILIQELASLCAKAVHIAASSLDGLSLQSLAGSASAEDENTRHVNEIIKNFKANPPS